ncbi:inositol monophosphatase family protein [Sphingosinicella sp. CPCC 101087]|uniref:inositol monophosphatase family protein n=1 Tax=Sphingosinicella sp. CPCC 101087 TaxID=2497754 RepID=UPI0013EB0117|nr:inositol monophosphatase family protein [Sphingosinicella sp. CPCC 101087]
MASADWKALTSFACRLADAARDVTLPAAAAGIACEDKSGGGRFDPVTEADREAERVMRVLIEAHHPDHGIEGEELEPRPARGSFVWSLDPIDGTRAFICGMPGWTTLIALLHERQPAVGVIDVPRLDERYVGTGEAAWVESGGDRQTLRTSGCTGLGEARLSTTDPYLFAGTEAEAFERLRRSIRVTRYGYDAYAYARLAAGSIDLVAESGLSPHDLNALVPVIRGAGGVVGNWAGGDDLSDGQLLAAASPALFEQAVRLLSGDRLPARRRSSTKWRDRVP